MKIRLVTVLFVLIGWNAKAQVVYENHRSEVYQYLYRMAQKGLVVFDDNIRPLSRVYIASCLDSLQARVTQLSRTEQKELSFYQQEYTPEHPYSKPDTTQSFHPVFFKKTYSGRFRSIAIEHKDFSLYIDPILTASWLRGTGRDVKQYSSGFSLYGYAGKHWGWYLAYNDISEKGTGFDTLRQDTPETGIVGRIAKNKKSQNYSELRGGITYSWKNGSFSFGQDYLTWGYGENGQTVLSAKAPAYPYIRLDYKPLPWLRFNYTHAWLNSNILDSNATYRTGNTAYGGVRNIFVSKYMAAHSIQLTPWHGWDFSFGESIIYSDRMNIGYLVPVFFFKAFDNLNTQDINAGSNGQLFFQVSSRNNIRKTHLYATLFIDEVRIATIFDPVKSRNQLGYTIGGSITDVGVPYLTLGAEYTHINPFVYRNLIPAQNYTNSNYLLGDWMGNNADRWLLYAKYTPFPRLKCMIRYQYLRKGGAGTIDQQYFQQPQPPFLFDLQNKRHEWYGSVTYEWYNRLSLHGYFSQWHTTDYTSGASYHSRQLNIGLSYGL